MNTYTAKNNTVTRHVHKHPPASAQTTQLLSSDHDDSAWPERQHIVAAIHLYYDINLY